MRPANKPQDNPLQKIGKDTADTYGVRGSGSSWQASFGMALNEADLLFSVRREPVANRIVFQVAHDVFDNWFKVEKSLRVLMQTLIGKSKGLFQH